jgi:hypothetical protein
VLAVALLLEPVQPFEEHFRIEHLMDRGQELTVCDRENMETDALLLLKPGAEMGLNSTTFSKSCTRAA